MPSAMPPHERQSVSYEEELAELQLVTADSRSGGLSAVLSPVLRLVREHLGMDVVFVTELVEDQCIFRFVEAAPGKRVIEAGQSNERARTYCQRVLDGRLPSLERNVPARADVSTLPTYDFPIGCYLSVPIRLHGGRIYGLMCCFSLAPNEDLESRDLRRLEMAAQLASRQIEESGAALDGRTEPQPPKG